MSNKKAFSLIEMSIVIILMGLLITTILVSNQLRISAANRMMIKELNKINIALNQFDDLFADLPGDSNKIYDFWPNKCATVEICNGNGDGKIDAYKESHLSWFHLNLANLFDGNFTGAGDGDEKTQTININVPASSIENAQYSLIYYSGNEFPNKNLILVGGAVSEDIGYGTIMSADSAYNIDQKIDDGLPSAGNVFGRNGYKNNSWEISNCLIDENEERAVNTVNENKNIAYNMNLDSKECIMGISVERE